MRWPLPRQQCLRLLLLPPLLRSLQCSLALGVGAQGCSTQHATQARVRALVILQGAVGKA
jgi:hypothetical protein